LLKDRKRFIGWSEAQRQKNLPLVINDARFLVLPRIECKGLASKILSLAARQLPNDWLSRYGFRPVLLETFVEHERHKGTCFKAAKLDPCRPNDRAQEKIHQPQCPHPGPRYLALSATQKLRRRTLPVGAAGSPNIDTCGHEKSPKSLIYLGLWSFQVLPGTMFGGLHSLEIWRGSRMNAHIHQTEVYKLPGKLPGLVSCYLVIQWRDRNALIPARCPLLGQQSRSTAAV
jgi:hypothetical protein